MTGNGERGQACLYCIDIDSMDSLDSRPCWKGKIGPHAWETVLFMLEIEEEEEVLFGDEGLFSVEIKTLRKIVEELHAE